MQEEYHIRQKVLTRRRIHYGSGYWSRGLSWFRQEFLYFWLFTVWCLSLIHISAVTFDDHGAFYLKPGQKATFSGLKDNQEYYVEEIGVKSEEYDDIKINDVTYTAYKENESEKGKEVRDIRTSKEVAENRRLVVFTNNCSAANKRDVYKRQVKKSANNFAVLHHYAHVCNLFAMDVQTLGYCWKFMSKRAIISPLVTILKILLKIILKK